MAAQPTPSSSGNRFDALSGSEKMPELFSQENEDGTLDALLSVEVDKLNTEPAPGGEKMDVDVERAELVDTLPAGLQFSEPGYPDEMEGIDIRVIHKEYRGGDRPTFKFEDGKLSGVERLQGSLVWIRDSSNPEVFGRTAQPWIKTGYNPDSQVPSVKINIKRSIPELDAQVGKKKEEGANPQQSEESRWVTFTIFANHIRAEGEFIGFHMESGSDVTDFPAGSPMEELAAAGELWHTSLTLHQPGAKFVQPVVSGIAKAELDNIVTAYVNNADLSEPDRFIARLYLTSEISLYRRTLTGPGWPAVFERFRSYFEAAMFMSVLHGNFWYWTLQNPDVTSDSPKFDFTVAPPRWMQTKFVVGYQNDKPVKSKPWRWEAFNTIENYPNAETFAFLCRLGLNRERYTQTALLETMISSRDGQIEAKFTPVPGTPGSYVVDLFLGEINTGETWDNIMPIPDTRVEINYSPSEGKVLKYTGHLIEDLFGRAAQLYAAVRGPEANFNPDVNYNVSLELLDDPTSTNRCISAIQELEQGQHRAEGVDLPALVLGAPRTVADPGYLARNVTPEQRANFNQTLTKWTLNAEQQKAAVSTITSENGVVLIHGPPGTGKTRAIMAAVDAHVAAGHKVLVTGPSNESVDACLEVFKQLTELDSSRYCRFRGAYTRPQVDTADEMDTDGGDDNNGNDNGDGDGDDGLDPKDAVWTLLHRMTDAGVEKHLKDAFNTKRHQAVEKWSKAKDQPLHKEAKQYLQTLQDLESKTIRRQQKGKLRVKLTALEENVTAQVLDKDISVVFTTCSMSCHRFLMDYFHPDLIFVDEAGLGSTPDVATPLAAFKKYVKVVVMSGDHVQLSPVVTSRGTNEGYNALKIAMFKRLIMDSQARYPHVMLVRQYRMHPHIADWISSTFYGGKLQNAPHTTVKDGLQITLDEFFSTLGPAWNKRYRMAVDISGENARHARYENTQSRHNEAEGDVVAGLARDLVEFEPSWQGARRIKPEDINIVTPYTGQRRSIMKKLFASGGPESFVTVSTTSQVQGRESNIVLVSLVANEPGKPNKLGFIWQPGQLCVEMSRAKKFQMIVGNFRGWCKAEAANEAWITKRKRFEDFRSLIIDLYKKGDIISQGDWDSSIAGKAIESSGWRAMVPTIEHPQDDTSGRGRGRGRGGAARGANRGGGRGRGNATAGPSTRKAASAFDRPEDMGGPNKRARGHDRGGGRGGGHGGGRGGAAAA